LGDILRQNGSEIFGILTSSELLGLGSDAYQLFISV